MIAAASAAEAGSVTRARGSTCREGPVRHVIGESDPGTGGGQLRHVLGHFCSGITIVTALHEEQPVGFACQSFQSLSLEPPLVSFSPSRSSTTWPRIRSAGRFAINVLAGDQEMLCRAFAVSGGEKFQGIRWHVSSGGSPILDGVLAWIDCTVADVFNGGDHEIVVGQVLGLAARDAEPLLFFQGGYRQLSAR